MTALITPGAWGPEKLALVAIMHDGCVCLFGCRLRAARRWGAPV